MLREFSCLSVESDCYLRCYEFCVGGGGVRRRGGGCVERAASFQSVSGGL